MALKILVPWDPEKFFGCLKGSRIGNNIKKFTWHNSFWNRLPWMFTLRNRNVEMMNCQSGKMLRLKIAWDDPNWLKLFKMYLGGQSTLFEDKKSKIISFWVIWGEFEISPRRKMTDKLFGIQHSNYRQLVLFGSNCLKSKRSDFSQSGIWYQLSEIQTFRLQTISTKSKVRISDSWDQIPNWLKPKHSDLRQLGIWSQLSEIRTFWFQSIGDLVLIVWNPNKFV